MHVRCFVSTHVRKLLAIESSVDDTHPSAFAQSSLIEVVRSRIGSGEVSVPVDKTKMQPVGRIFGFHRGEEESRW